MAGDKHELMLPQWLAERRDGTYADGRRFDELCYLQCKLIVKPDRFTSAHVFKEFAGLVHRAADATGVAYHHTPKLQERPEVREVLFLDTGDFHLYNHAFILRRRIAYEDGFPVGDPEIVFKYRSPDMMVGAGDGCPPAHLRQLQDQVQARAACRSRTASAACAGCCRTMSSSA